MTIDITAPMVGKITQVLISEGQDVLEDDPVFMLEAMKVEMPITAGADGTIASIKVKPGDTVEAGTVLAELDD
jgi:acetyl-CoA/propionyl-CoA carboxylase biotin carboxyl carrier protein